MGVVASSPDPRAIQVLPARAGAPARLLAILRAILVQVDGGGRVGVA